MGCKSSKSSNQIRYNIEDDFEKTHILQADRFFDKATPMLKKTEAIRKRLYETIRNCYKYAGTSHLPSDKYLETVRTFLWAVSAGSRGQILRAGIKIVNGPPFISCSCTGLCEETTLLYKALRDYYSVVLDGAGTVKTISQDLTGMRDTLVKGRNRIDSRELAQTIEEYARNMAKFEAGLKRVKDLSKMMQTVKKFLNKSVPTIRKMMEEADDIGRKASNLGLAKPTEIYLEFGVRPKRMRKDKGFDLSNDEIEEAEEIRKNNEKLDEAAEGKKSKGQDQENIFEGDEDKSDDDQSQKSGISKNRKSKKKKRRDSSSDSSDFNNSRHHDKKQTFGVEMDKDVLVPQKMNKIQVNAPEMKDLSSVKKSIEKDYFPKYKFYTPEKNLADINVTPFDFTRTAINPFSSLTVNQSPQKVEELPLKPLSVLDNLIIVQKPKPEETKVPVLDIAALAKQYLPQDKKKPMVFNGNEDIADDDVDRRQAAVDSDDLVSFSLKRRYYMGGLQSYGEI